MPKMLRSPRLPYPALGDAAKHLAPILSEAERNYLVAVARKNRMIPSQVTVVPFLRDQFNDARISRCVYLVDGRGYLGVSLTGSDPQKWFPFRVGSAYTLKKARKRGQACQNDSRN